jgi:hypothetical protein
MHQIGWGNWIKGFENLEKYLNMVDFNGGFF